MSVVQALHPGELNFLDKPTAPIIVTQFQPGHGFTEAGFDSSHNYNDTTDFVIGGQAMSAVTNGAGGIMHLRNSSMPAVNALNKVIGLIAKLENVTHVGTASSFQVYAFSGGGTANFASWNLHKGTDNNPFFQEGIWRYITLNFGDATITGSFDQSAITGWQIACTDDNTGQQVTVHVNEICLLGDGSDQNPTGVFSPTFDDGYDSQYNIARPVMDAYGFPGTAYIIKDQVDVSGYMSMAQLKALRDQNGWEIGAHAFTGADHNSDFTGISSGQVEQDLYQLKTWLMRNGFRGQHNLALPHGAYTNNLTNIFRKYFSSVRTINGRTNETFPPANPMILRAQTGLGPGAGGVTAATISTMITKAVANKQWLIVTFHRIIPQLLTLTMSGNTATLTFAKAVPWGVGNTLVLAGFTPSGLNGSYPIASLSGGGTVVTLNIGSNPGNATVIGSAVTSNSECDYASFQNIMAAVAASGIAVHTVGEVMRSFPRVTRPRQIYRTPMPDENYTASTSDDLIVLKTITASRVLALPSGTAGNINTRIKFVDESGSLSGSVTVSITPAAGQTIAGSSSPYVLSTARDSCELIFDGVSNWDISIPSLTATKASAPVQSVAGKSGAVTLAESDVANLTSDLAAKAPLASPAFTGSPSAPTPVNPSDLAIKSYVDGVAAGLSIKASVQLATAAALPTNTYVAGVITVTATGVLTVDGVAVALNDRVLVQNEAAQANNGIYVCTTAGAVGVAAVLTRATDSTSGAQILGAFTFVEKGTANANAGFVNTNTAAPTIGTTAITYTQFSGAGEITAGNGLTKAGNTLAAAYSATTPAAASPTAPTAGVSNNLARADHAHPRYEFGPADHGFLAWTYDPTHSVNSSVLAAGGTIYLTRMHIPVAMSVTNIALIVSASGVGLTSGQCFAGIYQNGTLLGTTADQSASWNSTGAKIMPIAGGPINVPAGDIYIAFFANATTTLPGFARGSSNAGVNANLSGTSSRYGQADTGRTTSFPSTLGTISSLAVSTWAALS